MGDEVLGVTEGERRSTVVLTDRAPAQAARAVMARREWWKPGEVTAITPGRMAARALGVRHTSLADLALTALAGRGLRFAGALARRAALRSAVEDSWSTSDPGGTARSVEGTVRELLAAGAGVGTVAEVEGFPRLTKLLALVAAYRRHLAAAGLVDRAEALWLAADRQVAASGGPVTGGALLVCGYPTLAPAELAFLTSYAAPGSVLVLPGAPATGTPSAVAANSFAPNEELAAALGEAGWLSEREEAGQESRPPNGAGTAAASAPAHPRLTGHRLASLDAEVRFVLTAVKRLVLGGVAAADIALVAADPRVYGPTVVAVAREYGVAVRPMYDVPLAATPLGHLVASVVGVVAAGLPYEETARLLEHHLVPRLDEQEWAAARLSLPSGLAAWTPFDPRVMALAWPRRASRAEYTALLESTLAELGALEVLEAGSGRVRWESLLATLAVHAAGAGPVAAGQAEAVVTLATYLDELFDHLQLVKAVSSGSSGDVGDVVELVAISAVAGAAVDHLFLLGAAEGVVPARLESGARLDFVDREAARAAGLLVTDATLAAQREALAFAGIMRAAGETLTLTFPESGERAGQLPSPYFAALGLEPLALGTAEAVRPGAKQAASSVELRRHALASGQRASPDEDPVLARARRALVVEALRESAGPPDEYDGVIGVPFPTGAFLFSATSLLALGQCAFKWYAQYALRLYEPEEADDQLSPLVRGNLYHQTLEIAFRAADRSGASTRERVLEALPAAFAVAEMSQARYTANWQQQRHQHLAALQRVVRSESFLPEGTEVVDAETRFGTDGAHPATWRGFDVSGRIDRIDMRAGVLTLVDYKTSASKPLGVQDASGEAKLDLQLPIYLEAAVPALRLGGADGGARTVPTAAEYYSLTKARVIASVSSSGENAFDSAALEGFAARAKASLSAGHYPVRPDRSRKACEYCSFDAVCRVGPRIERKRGADG